MSGNTGGKKEEENQGEDVTSPQRRKLQFSEIALKMHPDHRAALKQTCLLHHLPGLN